MNVGDHNRQCLIERFNRTLERFIALYHEPRKSNRCINVLEDIVLKCNRTYHRGFDDVLEARVRVRLSWQKQAKNKQKKIFWDEIVIETLLELRVSH